MNRCLMNSSLWVFVRVLILFAPVVCFIPDAAAQATAGSIVGRVTDPSKAVVVGAQITALNQATGVSYTSKSNEAGDYIIQRVPPGIYSVTVTQPGFQTEVAKDLELVIDQKLAIDFALKVGAPATIETVTAEAPLLQTESVETGSVIPANKRPSVIRSQLSRSFAAHSRGSGRRRRKHSQSISQRAAGICQFCIDRRR
jgi:hypothetical protein